MKFIVAAIALTFSSISNAYDTSTIGYEIRKTTDDISHYGPNIAMSFLYYKAIEDCPNGVDIIRQYALPRDDTWYMYMDFLCHQN